MKLKSLFISTWLFALLSAFIFLLVSLAQNFQLDYLFSVLAIGVWVGYFTLLYVFKTTARNDGKMPNHALAALVLSFASLMTTDHQSSSLAFILAIVLSVLLAQIYIRWYSTFDGRNKRAIRKNMTLPNVDLLNLAGESQNTLASLQKDRHSLWVVYRGNWCPFCVAQIKELFEKYSELSALGCDVYFVSPQSLKKTESLARQFIKDEAVGESMAFLQDAEFEFAEAIESVAINGTPVGLKPLGYANDTVMPSVLISDDQGKILYADLTDNYRVRPEPETFIKILKTL